MPVDEVAGVRGRGGRPEEDEDGEEADGGGIRAARCKGGGEARRSGRPAEVGDSDHGGGARLLLCSSIPNPNPGDGAVACGSPFTDGAIWSESELEEHVYVGEAARPARRRSVLPWFLTERHEEEKIMVKEKGNEKGKGAGKENAKAKAKEKSVNYLKWAFGELYGEGSTRFRTEIKTVEKELAALYDKCVAQNKRAGNGESSSSSTNIPSIPVQAGYEAFLSSRSTRISKSELRNYLEDAVAPRDKALDLLGWWKENAPRYPMLAKIAKRFITIPATSVSSESTFSTTGRILDDYRSSLKPVMVEALVCGASYIKGAHVDLNLVPRDENEEDDVENIKLPTVVEEIND
ncbi:uncharacterized protein [Triticum aestivum]|uniref:uncharacterized protein n=1 Tax=Triticum aestivum TaxID=4565 RepID=UPI001D01D736|nr:uncharacterized protein LOC123191507 [Triticum aestivum]